MSQKMSVLCPETRDTKSPQHTGAFLVPEARLELATFGL
jgi:hypothetical protein